MCGATISKSIFYYSHTCLIFFKKDKRSLMLKYDNLPGFRGRYLQLNLVVSTLLLLVHAAWHSVLAGFAPYGSLLEDYPIIQTIGYNLGLVSYAGIDPLMAVHYLAPEVNYHFICIITLSTVGMYTGCNAIDGSMVVYG